MKIIITEDQLDTIKKIKSLKKYIDNILSEYDWYEGIDGYKVEPFIFRSNDLERFRSPFSYQVPLYKFNIKTNNHEQSFNDTVLSDSVINYEMDEIFELFFPRKKDGRYSALWEFNFVRI